MFRVGGRTESSAIVIIVVEEQPDIVEGMSALIESLKSLKFKGFEKFRVPYWMRYRMLNLAF